MANDYLGRIWVFDETRLADALKRYEQDALAAYPHQEERIGVAVAAIRDFLYSAEFGDELTMFKGKKP